MREIRFRVWDNLNKKWLLGYEYPNLGGFSMMGEVMMSGEYSAMLNSFSLQDWDEIRIMQYTGLNDKNGTPIYEGDLLKSPFFEDRYVPVIWDSFHAQFTIGGAEFNVEVKPENIEVLGNIYENENLLTK
jgi:hypothetical protein